MAHCTNCNSEVGPQDKFCGDCGAKVAVAPDPVVQPVALEPAPATDPKPVRSEAPSLPNPPNEQATNQSQKRLMMFGAAAVVAVGVVLGLSSTFQSDPPPAPAKVVASAPKPPPRGVQQTQAQAKSAQPSRSSQIASIPDYIQRVRSHYQAQGIHLEAPHQIDVQSCDGCVPFLFYCSFPIRNATDVKGKKVRVSSEESTQLITRMGGNPQRIAFAEVHAALRLNLIECSVSGGGPVP